MSQNNTAVGLDRPRSFRNDLLLDDLAVEQREELSHMFELVFAAGPSRSSCTRVGAASSAAVLDLRSSYERHDACVDIGEVNADVHQ